VRRFAMIVWSLSLLLGLTPGLIAQDRAKEAAKADEKKAEAPKPVEKKAETPKPAEKADAPKPDEKKAEKAAEAPLPSIPPEVEAKLEAARRAVAEAIVAAQDAGLVETTIDPPPILDILITGRATDARELKRDPKERKGVSPEVFGAWFTGYGKAEGINPEKDVRIVQPSNGLKDWYSQRANLLNRHLEAVRKTRGEASKAKKEETKKEETKKEETKKESAKGGTPK
jgi:hypothetical protein